MNRIGSKRRCLPVMQAFEPMQGHEKNINGRVIKARDGVKTNAIIKKGKDQEGEVRSENVLKNEAGKTKAW